MHTRRPAYWLSKAVCSKLCRLSLLSCWIYLIGYWIYTRGHGLKITSGLWTKLHLDCTHESDYCKGFILYEGGGEVHFYTEIDLPNWIYAKLTKSDNSLQENLKHVVRGVNEVSQTPTVSATDNRYFLLCQQICS